MSKIFSIPFNPNIDDEYFERYYVPFVERNKSFIFDIYMTVRIEPFLQDSMGAIYQNPTDTIMHAMFVKDKFGIPVTATFNNAFINPSLGNRDKFIKNFRPLYEAGIKSVIIPFQHWLYDSVIRKEFPELYIKNTIVNSTTNLQDIYNQMKVYDYIHINRNLMRDRAALYRLQDMRKMFEKEKKISLLANENCIGNCPVQTEHYLFNNTRTPKDKPYFENKLCLHTCNKWRNEDPFYFLKIGNIIPLKSEYDRLLKYVDTFKMHGRDNLHVLKTTMEIVDNYRLGKEELVPDFIKLYKYYTDEYYEEYLEVIKSCGFQCWDCEFGRRLERSKK